MEVYHTSNVCVEKPDTKHSRLNLDFGPGFYFTSIRSQAEKYASRFLKLKQKPWLNIYDFDEDWRAWNVLVFEKYDEEWLDFVLQCREGNVVGSYDMVVGGIADDKVFDTIDLYLEGLISKDEALRRLVYHKPNIQYCIRSGAMLSRLLKFKESLPLWN